MADRFAFLYSHQTNPTKGSPKWWLCWFIGLCPRWLWSTASTAIWRIMCRATGNTSSTNFVPTLRSPWHPVRMLYLDHLNARTSLLSRYPHNSWSKNHPYSNIIKTDRRCRRTRSSTPPPPQRPPTNLCPTFSPQSTQGELAWEVDICQSNLYRLTEKQFVLCLWSGSIIQRMKTQWLFDICQWDFILSWSLFGDLLGPPNGHCHRF